MTSVEKQRLEQLLELQEPWEIQDIRVVVHARRCEVDIGVAAPRSWFGFGRKSVAAVERGRWRHLDFGAYHLFVHVTAPTSISLDRCAWVGDEGQSLTRRMAAHLSRLLDIGASIEGLCRQFGVDPGEMWRLKQRLETDGRVSARGEPKTTLIDNSGGFLPAVDDPVWQRLAAGDISIEINQLSLRLLLTRIRSQYTASADESARRDKAQELHRFFLKNLRVLRNETSQLRDYAVRRGQA